MRKVLSALMLAMFSVVGYQLVLLDPTPVRIGGASEAARASEASLAQFIAETRERASLSQDVGGDAVLSPEPAAGTVKSDLSQSIAAQRGDRIRKTVTAGVRVADVRAGETRRAPANAVDFVQAEVADAGRIDVGRAGGSDVPVSVRVGDDPETPPRLAAMSKFAAMTRGADGTLAVSSSGALPADDWEQAASGEGKANAAKVLRVAHLPVPNPRHRAAEGGGEGAVIAAVPPLPLPLRTRRQDTAVADARAARTAAIGAVALPVRAERVQAGSQAPGQVSVSGAASGAAPPLPVSGEAARERFFASLSSHERQVSRIRTASVGADERPRGPATAASRQGDVRLAAQKLAADVRQRPRARVAGWKKSAERKAASPRKSRKRTARRSRAGKPLFKFRRRCNAWGQCRRVVYVRRPRNASERHRIRKMQARMMRHRMALGF